jgi:riboflavin transporter FmnP
MMEKVKTMEKTNRLQEILSNKKVKYVLGTILLSGIGIVLPRIFHVLAGSTAGTTFLPMHIAVLIAALTFGITSGSMVAGISIIGSYLLTGMPSLARLPYMLIELVIYAILLGVFHKKFNAYISLVATIILGRVFYAGVLFIAINGLELPTYGISVMQSIQAGLPGIAIQLICVPFIAKAIKKGIKLDD